MHGDGSAEADAACQPLAYAHACRLNCVGLPPRSHPESASAASSALGKQAPRSPCACAHHGSASSRTPAPRRRPRYYVQGFIYTRVCTHCMAAARRGDARAGTGGGSGFGTKVTDPRVSPRHDGGLVCGCRCFMQSWNSFITCARRHTALRRTWGTSGPRPLPPTYPA